MHVHDFHATILHLIGLDHEALTYLHNGGILPTVLRRLYREGSAG